MFVVPVVPPMILLKIDSKKIKFFQRPKLEFMTAHFI